jgi:hypothetical protein
MVIDIEWASHDDGALAQAYRPHGGANQRLHAGENDSLVFYGEKCLAALGEGEGAPVGLASCDGSDRQRWFVASGEIRGVYGLCLDRTDKSLGEGRDLVMAVCDGSATQGWNVCP